MAKAKDRATAPGAGPTPAPTPVPPAPAPQPPPRPPRPERPDIGLQHHTAHSMGVFVPRGPQDRPGYDGARWRNDIATDPARFVIP